MTHHDNHRATKAKDATHLTIEDAASLGTSLTTNIDTLVVERHILQPFHIILSEVADDAIGTGDGNRQTTPIALETATNTHILSRYV